MTQVKTESSSHPKKSWGIADETKSGRTYGSNARAKARTRFRVMLCGRLSNIHTYAISIYACARGPTFMSL